MKAAARPGIPRSAQWAVALAIAIAWCVGMFDRGYWTPDEPREADIAWRMSWQPGKAVPLLAGEPFCEKPPFTYWMAGAAIGTFGTAAWAARLPNLVYALLTALAVGALGRRAAGPIAGLAAAAAMSTFLLSYQVAIWLATDAPLLAAVAVALLGLYRGFHAPDSKERLLGYSLMHASLAAGFLAKSAAAWMVPALTLLALVIWERRFRELVRWELYAGLCLQAAVILAWVGAVYAGPEGAAHLKVFFWNNLVGRFTRIDAPAGLQYAAGHRNYPGKYLVELPLYLWPWTLLVAAAARRAWRGRHAAAEHRRPTRFAVAAFVPALALLSAAATARNVYLAPALPGAALLIGWWVSDAGAHDRWDRRALQGSALLLLAAVIGCAVAAFIVGLDSRGNSTEKGVFAGVSGLGLGAAAVFATMSWRAARRGPVPRTVFFLLLSYCSLLVGPASQIYRRVDAWQDLASIGREIERDAAGRTLILVAPDETTRAFIDMFARTSVIVLPGTANAADRLRNEHAAEPRGIVVAQLAGRSESPGFIALKRRLGLKRRPAMASSDQPLPDWAAAARLRIAHRYELPNGRRYALLDWGS